MTRARPAQALACGSGRDPQFTATVKEWGGDGAELDIVQPGTALAEFYQLSMAALAEPMISAGVMTASEAAGLAARPGEPDFLGCGFAFIGVWGRNGPPA